MIPKCDKCGKAKRFTFAVTVADKPESWCAACVVRDRREAA